LYLLQFNLQIVTLTDTTTNPTDPSFDGIYGARPVPASRDVTIASNRYSNDIFVTPNPGSGADCSYEKPCSLSVALGRTGYIWMFPGTYRPQGQIVINSGRTIESVNANDKAIIDFADRSLGIQLSGDNNVLRNIIVRRSTKDGILVYGSNNLIQGVTSEHNYGSGVYVYRNWQMPIADTSKASFNVFQDCIMRYNSDDCKGTGNETCEDGDADGIGFSAGVGNVIDHCEASYNSDDGFDFWYSYKSTITNSVAYRNGYDDAAGYEAGLRRGNGNGFKMGPGPIETPDGSSYTDHVIISNWANQNALRTFDKNGGSGQEFSDNVCHTNQESCTWWK
jgi:parallel beta-helix repeat protein